MLDNEALADSDAAAALSWYSFLSCQNLALTGLYVPHSLDSGPCIRGGLVFKAHRL